MQSLLIDKLTSMATTINNFSTNHRVDSTLPHNGLFCISSAIEQPKSMRDRLNSF